ncbi:uncharacterized protein LOC142584735 [Dermacentor variabilis]|uniref:uncharacterized protein LOC142584735 n=1 Tax=Dermacentor variabilis TaxID=34621 RepID=UPI003F5C4072
MHVLCVTASLALSYCWLPPPAPLEIAFPDFTLALKAIQNFTAIATTQDKPQRVCVSARVRQLDEVTRDTEVEWQWVEQDSDGSPMKHDFHFKLGYGLPNRAVMTNSAAGQLGADAILLYTDYNQCVVGLFVAPVFECTLWVHESAKDAVPDHCWAAYGNFCGPKRTLLQTDEKCKKHDR